MTTHKPDRGSITSNLVPFLVVTVIWGSTWLAIKDQLAAVPIGWTITWRFVLASAAMVLLARVRRESLRLPPGAQAMALLVGVSQFWLNYAFVYHSERYLASGIVAVLYALLIVPNAVLSALLLKAPVSRRFVAGSVVAIAGISLLLLHEARLAPPGGQVPLGILLSLAGLMSASVANVAQATAPARASGPVPFMAWSMIWGTLIDAVMALVFDGAPQIELSLRYLGGVAYLALLGSVVTFPLYFRLIRDMGAGGAAYTGVATPVVAMLLSTLFEGYRWSLLATTGAVLALAGLLIAIGARRGQPPAVNTARSPAR